MTCYSQFNTRAPLPKLFYVNTFWLDEKKANYSMLYVHLILFLPPRHTRCVALRFYRITFWWRWIALMLSTTLIEHSWRIRESPHWSTMVTAKGWPKAYQNPSVLFPYPGRWQWLSEVLTGEAAPILGNLITLLRMPWIWRCSLYTAVLNCRCVKHPIISQLSPQGNFITGSTPL